MYNMNKMKDNVMGNLTSPVAAISAHIFVTTLVSSLLIDWS